MRLRTLPLAALLGLALAACTPNTAPTLPAATPTTAASTTTAAPTITAAPTTTATPLRAVAPPRGAVKALPVLPAVPAAPKRTTAPRAAVPAVPRVVTPAAPRVTTKTTAPAPVGAYYANCTAARAAGVAPLHRGDPGYRPALDRDNDGVACE